MLKNLLPFFVCMVLSFPISAQTYSWSGYTSGATTYTTGIMTSTLTSSVPGFQYSSPRYFSGSTVGSGQCGIAGGLALECMFGNITSAHATLTIDFTSGGTTNGTCASIQFVIRDINADESVQTFRDFVYISAIDGNNTAIALANITTAGGSNKTKTSSGNTRIVAGSSGSYGSRSQTACDDVTVTVTPPAGTPLKSITIRYQPSYETCANCYYNWTGPNRPAYQYISISSLTGTATSGCTVLPVEITEFTGKCKNDIKELEWVTATETNNRFFHVQGSEDGEHFRVLGMLNGMGNSSHSNEYHFPVNEEFKSLKYFRLKQEDIDGKWRYSDMIFVDCKESFEINIYPNPAGRNLFISLENPMNISRMEIYDVAGRLVLQKIISEENQQILEWNIEELSSAYYTIAIIDKQESLLKALKFVKE